ncbi:hypothetical protein Vafri_17482 [Volvox africanus]|uniref:Uncharacterized protein n=1 Tax=Volvox africanus TaxID=51714 RepID=A0A8J4BL45_9CHLO|nr:hypothetical protein Vafri_17482 [Volvox africanus]
MYQDASTGAIAFDGNTCFGYSSQDLPSSWNKSAEAAFTAVWIGSFTPNTSKAQMLMTLSRTKMDYYQQLYWESTSRFAYNQPEPGYGFTIESSNMPAAPTDMWTLEAIVRPSGAASVSYHRYNKQRPYLQSWFFSGQPSTIFPDSFTIGADIRDNGKFLNGKVSVILVYNRALSTSELVQLSSFYANRFSWSKPTCPGYQQLPNNLRPEVVNLDACIGVIVQSGLDVAQAGASPTPPTTSAVRAWLDAEGGNSKGGGLPVQLNFTGNCLMYQDASTGAIAFDGNTCFGYSSQDLPSSWNKSAEAAFTAVWIGSFTPNTSKAQMLMTLSRTKMDYYQQLYWESTSRFAYNQPEPGYGFTIESSNMPAAPTDMWTLEAIVRPSGAASVSYHRYNKQRPYLQSWFFSGQPSTIFPDSFTIGADIRDNGKFLNGKVSVILVYNRALSTSELVQLSSFYANRFSWSKPTCPGYQQLPNNLRPEVVNLDACIGVIVQSGLDVAQAGASPTPPTTSAVRAWLDAEGGNSKGGGLPVQLNFTGNCLMYQDASTGAIAFDGNTCFGYSSQDLPSSWNKSAEAAFTAVWIGSFTPNTSKAQMLMTLSRTKMDYYQQLYWESTSRFAYNQPEPGYGFTIESSNMPAAPTDMWTLEAIVRPSGAASVSYHRYNKQRPYLQSWFFSGQPSTIFPDSFTIGADIRDNGKFLNGKVSVILVYNRALSTSELVQLSSFYANRFSWSKPSM